VYRPIRFRPYLRPQVWGGRRLGEELGKLLPAQGTYGESWELSDHPLHASVADTDPYKNRTLRSLIEESPVGILGAGASRSTQFPWLIKFLDAHDRLSIQVHPDSNRVAQLRPGEGSKTEAWYVIDRAPAGRIYAGLLPGIDETKLRTALKAGCVQECLHAFRPEPGDCIYLPAGTVHAVGGGVLMAEIQQTSDATFRLYDWNRRDDNGRMRDLHIEEAMASIHWDQGPVKPCRVPPDSDRFELVRCPFFVIEHWHIHNDRRLGLTGVPMVIVVLEGQGAWGGEGFHEEIRVGEVWLLPASSSELLRPTERMRVLVCTQAGSSESLAV
jgi:mannose-6-phosphate isomerase